MNDLARPIRLRDLLSTADSIESASDAARALETLVVAGALALPLPGRGATAARFEALAEIAAFDLSLARLAEGHADALAILGEARRAPFVTARGTARYGVWAAEPPDARVKAERVPEGFRLTGRKRYASGARALDRALVTAHTSDGSRLFEVALDDPRVHPLPGTWDAVGMSATDSVDVDFDGVLVTEQGAIGPAGFYVDRTGFWHGAIGVAACWYGGALGTLRMLHARLRDAPPNEHRLAHFGAIVAASESMRLALDHAARAIDAVGAGPDPDGRRRALFVRHVVEQGCQEVLTRAGRASGSSPLVFDRAHARRAADHVVYLRQHHAEDDLAALGRLSLTALSGPEERDA